MAGLWFGVLPFFFLLSFQRQNFLLEYKEALGDHRKKRTSESSERSWVERKATAFMNK